MELVPIKVTIGLRKDGNADYPDFGLLGIVILSELNWSVYVDQQGSGWLYSCCGHKEVEPGSPFGQQFGMLLVPATFAAEAAAMYPTIVEILSEVEAETFYDDDVAKNYDEEILDLAIIEAITARDKVTPSLGPRTSHQEKAMDKDDPTPGIRPNWRKTFVQFKAKTGITIAP